ncbi:Crp/Fnr family transcriptional regulator [uncultured Maricaulis sp.]|uniref:Crp/Fnr family transcriptional regulator n=1 Tax=uncultured Maricaulis sp. TaxID=174710 RepID=UPI0030DBA4A7
MAADKSWALALDSLALTEENARAALISRAELRRYPPGVSVIAQDDEEDQVFLLLDGSVRVVLLSEGGQEIWLDTLHPGTIIGELAALTDRRRTSEIITETECELASYSAPAFLALMQQYGELGLALSRILARRVHHTTQRMFELSALSAPGRIYAEILRMSERAPAGQTRVIRPIPSLTAIALRVNTTRETVSRTVSGLERRGLLRRQDNTFELVDPDHLARLSTAN